MSTGERSTGPVFRTYAWLAIVGWFGGILGTLVSTGKTGEPFWPLFLVIAGSVPLIPLIITRGPGVLGPSFVNLFPDVRRPGPVLIVWPIAFVLMTGLCFFAWATREDGLVRHRVREFMGSLSEEAQVLVDGEYFTGERADSLLGPLSELEPEAGHHSHPEESFLVRLIDGERQMELELCRDSDRRREYWVYLLNEGSHRELNEIGRITTDVLDDLVPIRIPKRRRNRPPVREPGS